MNKRYLLSIIVIIVQIIFTGIMALQLADEVRIPVHWNIQGEIDGYAGKWSGLLLFPAINLGLLLFMMAMPIISVRYRNNPQRYKMVLPVVANIIITFFAIIHAYSVLLGADIINTKTNMILVIIGGMFVILGNYLPKIPSTYYVGIRTPWTLSSEEVWRKTHKLGGLSFMLGGLLMIFIPFLFPGNTLITEILFITFIFLVLIPIVYSFILYKTKEK